MSKTFIVANWKMNAGIEDVLAFNQFDPGKNSSSEVVICPSSPLLGYWSALRNEAGFRASFSLGGQDCHTKLQGAYTGETSALHLAELGARYVIAGHSERRLAGEDSATVKLKAEAALEACLCPIICVGETLEDREKGKMFDFVLSQIEHSLPESSRFERLLFAYEPIWAIGTGLVASLEDISSMHGEIRSLLQSLHPDSRNVSLLYGGSIKPGNAGKIFALENVDGGLVGGASLTLASFRGIIDSCP